MATIKEIAKLAEVSAATVSRVLNKDETLVVGSEVRARVFKVAHELKYVPPKMRHTQKTEEIIIGIADWHIIQKDRPNICLDSVQLIAKQMANKNKVHIVRMTYREEVQVDGILAFGSFADEEMEYLRQQSYRIVFINSELEDYEFDRIIMDYNQGIQDMVGYLIDQKEYRSIGYIGGLYSENHVNIGFHRMNSLKQILKERDFFQESYFKIGEISKNSGYELAKDLLRTKDIPEVLILGSDEVAEGALEAIKEEKYRIPKDIAVVIYKDIDTLETKYPTYTKLRMLPEVVWTTAINLILGRIIDNRIDAMKIFLPTKLELGDSA